MPAYECEYNAETDKFKKTKLNTVDVATVSTPEGQ